MWVCLVLMIASISVHNINLQHRVFVNGCFHITLAGAWIQMAGLNRMWSHSCLSSKMPFCKLLRYLEKASTMSRTGRVTCTLEDWSADRKTVEQQEVINKEANDKKRAHLGKEELLFCLTSTRASCDLLQRAGEQQNLSYVESWCEPVLVCFVVWRESAWLLHRVHYVQLLLRQGGSLVNLPAEPICVHLTFSKV